MYSFDCFGHDPVPPQYCINGRGWGINGQWGLMGDLLLGVKSLMGISGYLGSPINPHGN